MATARTAPDALGELAVSPPVHSERPISPPTQPEPPTVQAETLFEHLLRHRERISYGAAYRAMLGPADRPWRSLIDVPLVLGAARGTVPRSVGELAVRLDALIVNKKTQRPGRGHFKERAYAEDAWLDQFAEWSMCGHAVDELHRGKAKDPGPSAQEPERATRAAEAAPGAGAGRAAELVAGRPVPTVSERQRVLDGAVAAAPAAGEGRLAAASGAMLILVLIVAGSFVASRVVASPVDAPQPQVLGAQEVRDRFDSLPIGADPGWQTSGAVQGSAVGVAPWPTSIDRSVRLKTGEDGQAVTACRTIAALRGGVLVTDARIFLDGFGGTDSPIASIRAGSSEVAALRLGPAGEIREGVAATRSGASTIAVGTWYDVAFDLDVSGHRYRMTVTKPESPNPLAVHDGSWTAQDGSGIDRICFAPPGGIAGRSLYINEMRVTAR